VRRSVPAATDLAKSRKLMSEAFAAELRDSAPAARRALASKLLDEAAKMGDAPADRFVVLSGAIEAAVEGADLALAFQAADRMADGYVLDALDVKATAALKVPPKGYAASDLPVVLALLDALESAEEFATASRLIGVLQQVPVGDPSLRSTVPRRAMELEQLRAARERVAPALQKLKASPDDPAANLAVGQYTALVRGDWEHGLAFLAKGSDPKLAKLAKAELLNPANADARAELADGWWEIAGASFGRAKLNLTQHAAENYQLALPGLTGLKRVLAERRIAVPESGGIARQNVAPSTASPTVHLMSLINGTDLATAGWVQQGPAFVSSATDNSVLTFPYLPPDEYDLTAEFSRLTGEGDIVLAFPLGLGTCDFSVGAGKNTKACFGRINGKWAEGGNPTLAEAVISSNERHRMEVKVRREGIEGYLDGKRLCYWKPDGSAAGQRAFMPRSPGFVGIGTHQSSAAVYSVDLITVSGTGAPATERDRDGWYYNPMFLRPSATGALQLPGRDATVHGKKTTFDGKPGKDSLSHWESADDFVTWFVETPKPGEYAVEVTYGCKDDHAGSDVEIGVDANNGPPGAHPLLMQVQGTGGWDQFQVFSVGKIYLPAGRQTLWVKAKSMPKGAVMDLQRVLLAPSP
jgi:hypothetical protein